MNLLDTFYLPAAVVTAPWWARKTRSGWGERFGHIAPLPPAAPGKKRVLLHAVSVGEVGTLRGLVFSPALARFCDAVRPDVAALVELEVWPNFIAECGRRGVPVGVINGRLS